MPASSKEELCHVKYWNDRYEAERSRVEEEGKQERYECYRTFEKLRPFLERNISPTSDSPRILQLGYGTSSLTADLFNLGYQNQCSIDFSPVAIEVMKTRYPDLEPGLEWRVMDVREIKFDERSFNLAIDKGALDAMLYGSLLTPEPAVLDNVKAYVDEVARVLRPGGKWLCITYQQPRFLKPLLSREEIWEVHVESLQDARDSFEYFGFVMTKYS
jgi:EEF1A lysine methyltransferase 4